MKSSEIAREIAHDSFVRLWLNRDKLDGNRSVKGYLFAISRNQLIRELRRQMKNPLLRDYVGLAGSLGAEARIMYDYDTFVSGIEEAKQTLSPRQREIYIKNKEDGLPVKDIAAELGIGEQVVRNQLSAALSKIRRYLIDLFGNIDEMIIAGALVFWEICRKSFFDML
ncbi:MAG: sigma-70 family RNA polymerase sigma factor [Clostridium sp.]|nr:sigma-70 family RNA polymerase sigma factor [Bacteroides sp.]MCM1198250.1 sigma-70 family RNA polymerase sigma factor [Clostridium sp.]